MEGHYVNGKKSSFITLGGKGKGGSKIQYKENNHPLLNLARKDQFQKTDVPYAFGKPIKIRYIDTRLVPLLVQLGKLSKMAQNIVCNSQVLAVVQKKQELQMLMKSTKDLNEKVSIIMEQNSVELSQGISIISDGPERANSEYEYVTLPVECDEIVQKKEAEKEEVVCESQQNVNIVQILQKVALKLDEMQFENSRLQQQLKEERQLNRKLSDHNNDLKETIEKKQYQDSQKFKSLRQQLAILKKGKQNLGENIEKISKLLK